MRWNWPLARTQAAAVPYADLLIFLPALQNSFANANQVAAVFDGPQQEAARGAKRRCVQSLTFDHTAVGPGPGWATAFESARQNLSRSLQ